MEPIEILFEEYRQLYGIVLYRLAALDQRIPAAGVLLNVLVTTTGLLSPVLQTVLLVGLPMATIGLLISALNHARSFTDAVTRISAIEQSVNTMAGEMLLAFQTTHPSQAIAGGRTGRITINIVQGASAVLLGGCLYLSINLTILSGACLLGYHAFVVAAITILLSAHSVFDNNYKDLIA